MNTRLDEQKAEPNKPIIIEGLPGLGSVGRIVTSYLSKQSMARRIATLYSPHFSYYALADSQGV